MERAERQRRGGGLPRCSFCGRTSAETSHMHAGPEWARICNGCAYGAKGKRGAGPGRPRTCSFCGSERKQVEWIYGGSLVGVCNRCVEDFLREIAAS